MQYELLTTRTVVPRPPPGSTRRRSPCSSTPTARSCEQTGSARRSRARRATISATAPVIALDARFATSFTTGLIAAINPCGFVLLPTYLMYFLGMENLRPGHRADLDRPCTEGQRGRVGRVHARLRGHRRRSPSGRPTGSSNRPRGSRSPSASPSSCSGWRWCSVSGSRSPRRSWTSAERDRTVRSMFVFGIAYAVASIGCTLAPFIAIVLGAVSSRRTRRRDHAPSGCTASGWRWSSPASR